MRNYRTTKNPFKITNDVLGLGQPGISFFKKPITKVDITKIDTPKVKAEEVEIP